MPHSNANCAMLVDVIVTIATVDDDAILHSVAEYPVTINLQHNFSHNTVA